jgi:prepilin-type N-terminal cleavage/methylation domain-containing protein
MDSLSRRKCSTFCGLTQGVKAHYSAFTLIELLVVIAIIAILAAILMPVLQKAQGRARTAQCLSNKKQMAMGWVMYSGDNNDWLMPNADETVDTNYNVWVKGVMTWNMGGAHGPDDTNTEYLSDSLLGTVASKVVGIFKCPEDTLKCIEGSQPMDRVRSVSMNGFLEGGIHDVDKSKAGIPTDENYFTYKNGGGYPSGQFYSYNKLTEIGKHGPGPADMIVFTDENADTIDDGMFLQYAGVDAGTWFNLPGSYHARGDALSFADGHADIHKWLTGNVYWQPKGSSEIGQISIGVNKTDINWIYTHTTAPHP